MLEVNAHNHLKKYYQNNFALWPHNLTLTRLISRSLRRQDNTLIQLSTDSQNYWWPGLLIPLCLESNNIALILSEKQRLQIIDVELPKLKLSGLNLDYVEGIGLNSPGERLCLLSYKDLFLAYRKDDLQNIQLIFPQSEFLSSELRQSMSITITRNDWEDLINSYPSFKSSIINNHARLSRKLFSQVARHNSVIRIESREIEILHEIIQDVSPLPLPWKQVFEAANDEWVTWAQIDSQTLHWDWHFQPLTPLNILSDLWSENTLLMLTNSGENSFFLSELKVAKCSFSVELSLGNRCDQEPLPLFVPKRQPLPNTPSFYRHLLNQCRRLVFGRLRITIILIDDLQLRLQLTSELAGEFGYRVVHENTNTQTNGIICCSCDWWIMNHDKLPVPDQLVFAMIPFPTLEMPLIAARVELLKHQGKDWFREFLLPETLSILLKSIVMIRGKDVRVAILDGRMRYRSWGKIIFRTLEPWIILEHLLPY